MEKYSVKQVIVIRKDLNMRKGKMCVQAAHASMKFLTDAVKKTDIYDYNDSIFLHLKEIEKEWIEGRFAKIVVSVDSEQELLDLIKKGEESNIRVCSIIDSGYTEFHNNPTLTCAAFGPDKVDKLDKLTGHLKLL